MGLFDAFRASSPDAVTREEFAAVVAENEFLQEGMADLELALEDRGWLAIGQRGEETFSREGILRAGQLARVVTAANPLVRRGLAVRTAYVWGGGPSIVARATGAGRKGRRAPDGEQDVNTVIQAFLDDPGNRQALTGAAAQASLERGLFQAGDVYSALFTSPLTGFVRARRIPAGEIHRIHYNPDDASDPWFYERHWTQQSIHPGTGVVEHQQMKALYPAVRYRPRSRPARYGDLEIRWDSPVVHASTTGEHDGMGLPDAYSALGWARAYKEFLEDWAKLIKSLSRFAWRTTGAAGAKASKAAATLRAAQQTVDPATGQAPVGAAAIGDIGLEAIPKSGATIDSESGRPLAAMVAAALDIPVTMLLSDPGVTGARATAETLDDPTERVMSQRRGLWADFLREIFDHVIDSSARAAQGPLKGRSIIDPYSRTETVVLDGDTDRTVEITWPAWSSTPVDTLVKAITEADGASKLPPLVIARLLLDALGVGDVDEILDELTDDEGNWVGPDGLNPGDAALRALDRGGIPMPPTDPEVPASGDPKGDT